MAHNNKNLSKEPVDKTSVPKRVIKKKQNISKTIITKIENSQPKANLRRSKLPSNWNTYVETHNLPGTSKKVAQKFPKNLTTNKQTQNAKVENGMTMGPCQMNPPSSGRVVAIDCEMVGIVDGRENMLARVSLVDENGSVIYDTFVKPQQRVIDYRTPVSGVRPIDMENGRDFKEVQNAVYEIIKGRLLVGHALKNDLQVLFLSHPKKHIRDTSRFKKFRDETEGRTPSLKFLSSRLLGIEIQEGEHSSIEDARAAMRLYMKYRNSLEGELRSRFYKK